MSRKYKFGEKEGAYFISFATVYWIDVFTRDNYFSCIIESLDFAENKKEWRFIVIVLCQVIYI